VSTPQERRWLKKPVLENRRRNLDHASNTLSRLLFGCCWLYAEHSNTSRAPTSDQDVIECKAITSMGQQAWPALAESTPIAEHTNTGLRIAPAALKAQRVFFSMRYRKFRSRRAPPVVCMHEQR